MNKFKLLKRSSKTHQPIVNACLIVYANSLLYTGNDDLVVQHDIELNADSIAQAAQRLLLNNKKLRYIALALPPNEFIATSLKLPALDGDKLKGAVNLQLANLLPGNTEPLLLAVQGQKESMPTVALWLPSKRAEELFTAFEKVGLFLSCIIPRTILAVTSGCDEALICDEDDEFITFCDWSGVALTRWLHIPKSDWDLPEFKAQIEREIPKLDTKHYAKVADWENLASPCTQAYNYAFIPPSSILRQKQQRKQRQRFYMFAAAGLIILMIISGLLGVFYYKQQLRNTLNELRSQTMDVNQLRQEALAIDQEISPIRNFPKQQMSQIFLHLNEIIPKNSHLSRLTLEAGVIQIEGISPDAATLVQVLNQDPMFTEVRFSRGIGGSQDTFGISFKLADVDVQAYWEKYFLTETPRKRATR
jgi:hypothetical protein